MCGFAGILSPTRAADPADFHALLGRMASILRHRGPDEDGVLVSGNLGLAFARLSIIDLQGSHQPMESEDGRLAIVFNGEAYNFRQLRLQLEALGSRFRTQGDTEVLLEAYRHWGTGMLDRLNGMFAFAIDDRQSGELFLARDRFGIKPLYYGQSGGEFIFGSEIKALRQVESLGREIDPVALDLFLRFTWIPAPRTIHPDIKALPPGCFLRVSDSEVEITRYWRNGETPEFELDEASALRRLKELLLDSVHLRMIADVPLGAFLSAGIDSGLVVAAMARSSDNPVKTFSVGFDDETTSELSGARSVARMYGTDHHEIHCATKIDELVEDVFPRYDQPFADTSALPTFLICREARQKVTVVLSGDGGDESFAGYSRHQPFAGKRASQMGNQVLHGVAAGLSARLGSLTRGRNRLRRLGMGALAHSFDNLSCSDAGFRRQLAGPRLVYHVSDALGSLYGSAGPDWAGTPDALRLTQLTDIDLYLPNDILEKVDKASMMNSLEVRVPLLDHRIVDFGVSLPAHMKNDGRTGKLLLRRLAEDWLPSSHVRRRKTGFSIPRDRWLRTNLRGLMQDLLGSSRAASEGWLNQKTLDRLVAHHLHGRPYGTLLWSLLVFELWYRSRF